jgi:hypothetical protein
MAHVLGESRFTRRLRDHGLLAAERLRAPNPFDAFLDQRLRVARGPVATDLGTLRRQIARRSVLVMDLAERADLIGWRGHQSPLTGLTTRNDRLRGGFGAATVLHVAALDAFEWRTVGEEQGTFRRTFEGSAGPCDSPLSRPTTVHFRRVVAADVVAAISPDHWNPTLCCGPTLSTPSRAAALNCCGTGRAENRRGAANAIARCVAHACRREVRAVRWTGRAARPVATGTTILIFATGLVPARQNTCTAGSSSRAAHSRCSAASARAAC